jgi:spore coat polysaccharide biosynthesis predicted glycosyltransferase SpsG
MIFRRFQQIAFFVFLVEVFRALYGTGIFQPIEDYFVDLRERMTERILVIAIKMGGGLSLFAILLKVLLSIDPIYYLIFFTVLLIAHNSWTRLKKMGGEEFVVIDRDQTLDLLIEQEYEMIGMEEENQTVVEDEWTIVS